MDAMRQGRMLARYNAWAGRMIFDAAAKLPPEEVTRPRKSVFKSIAHMLNHIYVIGRVFQAHLEGRAHGYTARNTPGHPPLEELRRAQAELDAWYVSMSDALTPATAMQRLRFDYIGGGAGEMTRAEMLLHVVNHGTYHRGFVADFFYQIPVQPPATDLTVYLRDVPQDRA